MMKRNYSYCRRFFSLSHSNKIPLKYAEASRKLARDCAISRRK